MRIQTAGAIVEMKCEKAKKTAPAGGKEPVRNGEPDTTPDQFQNQCVSEKKTRIRREESNISKIDGADDSFYPDIGMEEYGYVDSQDDTIVAEAKSKKGCPEGKS